jgi:NitT/TauT family transport system substrate-binding protein
LRSRSRAARLLAPLLLAALALAVGCGSGGSSGEGHLRLGYFLNVTHAAPVVGLERGIYERHLPGIELETREFLAGPEAVTAMLAGSLDASYLGSGPVVTAASRAPEQLLIVAGANDAGAILIARAGSGIRSVADLDGRSVAFPGYGNTQDLALRLVLRRAGLDSTDQGGTVRLVKTRNADVATSLQRGQLDAAMMPEPWGTLLIDAGDAELVLDASEVLGGDYPTTVLVVTRRLAEERPGVVRDLVAANCEAVALTRRRPGLVVSTFQAVIRGVQGRAPSRESLVRSVGRLRPTTVVSREGMDLMIRAARDAGYLEDEVDAGAILAPSARAGCPAPAQGDSARG